MTVDEFFSQYAADFATYDAATVAAHFAYPVQAIGDTGAEPSVATALQEEWVGVIGLLLAAYEGLGVTGARRRRCEVTELGPGVRLASVGWTLLRADGSRVYDFDACYTLVRVDDRLRIAAIAHNELPRLQAALAG
jgi:hypothetical protein